MADDRIRMKVRRGDWEFEVEGPREYVEERIARAEAELGAASTGGGKAGRTDVADSVPTSRARLKDFVAEKKPRSHIETAVTIASWAKAGGTSALSGSDLDRYYKEAQVKRAADSLHILQRAASERGWFELAGEGKYRLTSIGEDFVTFDLPAKKGSRVGKPA